MKITRWEADHVGKRRYQHDRDVVGSHPSFAFFGESDPGPEYLRCFWMWIVNLQRYPDVEESVWKIPAFAGIFFIILR